MLTDSGDITIVTPSVLARINSDLIGPDDNVLVYLGIVAGVSILEIDVKGGSDINDESGAFGPKFGAEYYWTSNIAFQIEDTITFDTDEGLTNNLTLGVKYLFSADLIWNAVRRCLRLRSRPTSKSPEHFSRLRAARTFREMGDSKRNVNAPGRPHVEVITH